MSEHRIIAESLQAVASQIAECNSRFALGLYKSLKESEGNLFFSPFSISNALATILAGARGETKKEISNALCFSQGIGSLHNGFAALISSLAKGAEYGSYQLRTANRIWGDSRFQFRPEFLEQICTAYNCGLQALDFQNAPEPSRQIINRWVEEKTKETIKDLLSPGSVSSETLMLVTNAVYFKGDWANKFDKLSTKAEPFWVNGEEQIEIPMMFRKSEFLIGKQDWFKILSLPYEGGDLSMVILLPERGRLADLEDRLTFDNLGLWLWNLQSADVFVGLPRFETRSQYLLKSLLSDMGMPSAFDPGRADFSGISVENDFFINRIIHEAYVKVDEKGTEASAATGVFLMKGIVETEVFLVDHPFLFLIRDNITNSILFLRRMLDPR